MASFNESTIHDALENDSSTLEEGEKPFPELLGFNGDDSQLLESVNHVANLNPSDATASPDDSDDEVVVLGVKPAINAITGHEKNSLNDQCIQPANKNNNMSETGGGFTHTNIHNTYERNGELALQESIDMLDNENLMKLSENTTDTHRPFDCDETQKEPKAPVGRTAPDMDGEQKEREKRKSRVNRLLRPGVIPSFVALISPEDDSNSKIKTNEPVQIVIDVDEYLELKKPGAASSNVNAPLSKQSTPNPIALEGWYEGVCPVVLPDEKRYLNEFHYVIRSNLEFFSATMEDVTMSQAGRRTPVVLGKVGVRCIHCAKAAMAMKQGSDSRALSQQPKPWPAGSISYPRDIAALYSLISQKPALHFENCPNLSLAAKTDLARVSSTLNGNSKRQRKGDGPDGEPISAVMYYEVAAKRLGLIDSKGGIRFSRDLKLEPLSMGAVRAHVEEKRAATRKAASPTPVKSAFAASSASGINVDQDSEVVLAEAVTETDSDKKELAKPGDRALVSDFIFLCINQMAICNATEADFRTRGKKTKMMRLGFAGFCCRHCSHIESTGFVHNIDFSCRSFASAPDNLASAISSSFYTHLQKCFLVPDRMKKALAVYKRLHSRQLSQMPHGSQRKLFQLIWCRLRAADRTEAEMEAGGVGKIDPASTESASTNGNSSDLNSTQYQPSNNSGAPDIITSAAHLKDKNCAVSRPESFPICNDEGTQRVLNAAKEERENDGDSDVLFLASDRNLVTDFVFLIMKQLRVAHPKRDDFCRGRRSTVLQSGQAGLCCKYCMDQQQLPGASGRSFPSQPDNLASSLNTSLHQHMQKCRFVPDDMKRALDNLKKIHSVQLSHLRFGSQRRFFNLLFSRLSNVEVEDIDVSDPHETPLSSNKADTVDATTLARFGFMRSASGCFTCQRCRMVPIELRAAGSISFENSSTAESIRKHVESCKGNSFDLTYATTVVEEILQSCPGIKIDMIVNSAFKAIIRVLVGGNEILVHTFTHKVVEALQKTKDDPNVRVPKEDDTSGLWCRFPCTVDGDEVQKFFQTFATDADASLSPDLLENPCFVRYFQLVSPSFVVPVGGKEEGGGNVTEVDMDAKELAELSSG